MLFRYEAIDKSGKIVRGVMDVPDQAALERNLSTMGYNLRDVQGGRQPHNAAPQASSTAAQNNNPGNTNQHQTRFSTSAFPVSVQSKIPLPNLAAFFRQVVAMVRSGVPLYQSFVDVRTSNRKLDSILPVIIGKLQAGNSLSSAMAAHTDIFPVHTVSSVWSGELSGRMDLVLEELASELEQEAADNRFAKIGWGFTKISIITLIMVLPLFNMDSLLQQVLGKPGSSANVTTENFLVPYLQSYAQILTTKCIPIALLVIASWVVWGHLKRITSIRLGLDRILIRIPVWGKLHIYRGLARFFRTMETVYAAGLAPSRAWDAAGLIPKCSGVAEYLRKAKAGSKPNMGLTDLAVSTGFFDNDDLGMISSAEKSGTVPEMVSKLSSMYSQRADLQKKAARILSISAFLTGQIIVTGVVLIYVAKTYSQFLYKLME